MHLLCGEVSLNEAPERGAVEESVSSDEVEALKAEQKRQREELTQLRALVEHMAAELGISLDGFTPQS
jgi:hypothetical protein